MITQHDTVVFSNLATVSLTRASWSLSYIIDLDAYRLLFFDIEQFLEKLKNLEFQVKEFQYTIDKTGVYHLPIDVLMNNVEHLNQTKNDFKNSFLMYYDLGTRKRRALLPFVGSIYSSLFGLTTDTDLNDIREAVNTISNNQQQIKHVANSSLTLIKQNREEIVINRNKVKLINSALNKLIIQINLANNHTSMALQKLTDNVKLYTKFKETVDQARELVLETIEYFNKIRLTINLLTTGVFSPSAIPPDRLRSILKEIKKNLPPNLRLPIEDNKAIWHYYKYLKTEAIFEKEKLIVIIKIPLINLNEIYDIYKISNIPVIDVNISNANNNDIDTTVMTAKYLLESDYIALNKARSSYIIPNIKDIDACIRFPKGFCRIDSPIYPTNLPRYCVLALYKKENIHKFCKIKINTNVKLPIATQVSSGVWLISTNNKITFTVVCDNKHGSNIITADPPLSLINIKSNCVANSNKLILPKFTSYSSIENDIIKLPKINSSIFDLWKPARTIIKNQKIDNIDLGELKSIKNYDTSELQAELARIKRVKLTKNPWRWYEILILVTVILVGIFIAFYSSSKIRRMFTDKSLRIISSVLPNNINSNNTNDNINTAPNTQTTPSAPAKDTANVLYPMVHD